MVDKPTRGENTLDIFLTNCPDLIKSRNIVSGIGDHEAVRIDSSLRLKRKKPSRRIIRLWNKVNLDNLKKDVKKFSDRFLKTQSPANHPNVLWNCIRNNLMTAMDIHVPTKLSSSKIHQPWITQTKRLLRQKQRWFNKAKPSNSNRHWSKFKVIKKLTQKACRTAHTKYVQDLISDDNDNKKLWSYIKSKKKTTQAHLT